VIRSLVYRPATTASWYLGQLPILCFAEGMTSYLYAHKIFGSSTTQFCWPYRNQLRENEERLAAENGIPIRTLPRHGTLLGSGWQTPAEFIWRKGLSALPMQSACQIYFTSRTLSETEYLASRP